MRYMASKQMSKRLFSIGNHSNAAVSSMADTFAKNLRNSKQQTYWIMAGIMGMMGMGYYIFGGSLNKNEGEFGGGQKQMEPPATGSNKKA